MSRARRRKRRREILVSIIGISPNQDDGEAKLAITKSEKNSEKNFIKTNWGRKIFL